MLHRTNALQVEKIFINFVTKYPDFRSICDAGQKTILKDLAFLGLKWRSELLYKVSCELTLNYDGHIPLDKNELLKLPGIGPYISSAFLCFAYNLPEPMLDTNTVRIIGRIFGLKINDSSRRSKIFEKIMENLVKLGNCKDFSLSLIDFAEAVCKPHKPLCNECILNDLCQYKI